jgi:hypothetical protein
MTETQTPLERRLKRLEDDIALLKLTVHAGVCSELEDIKEGFEHTDDSVSNIRTTLMLMRNDIDHLKKITTQE